MKAVETATNGEKTPENSKITWVDPKGLRVADIERLYESAASLDVLGVLDEQALQNSRPAQKQADWERLLTGGVLSGEGETIFRIGKSTYGDAALARMTISGHGTRGREATIEELALLSGSLPGTLGMLLSELVQAARERGASTIRIEVNSGREKTLDTLTGLGFRRAAERDIIWEGEESPSGTAFTMVLNLEKAA